MASRRFWDDLDFLVGVWLVLPSCRCGACWKIRDIQLHYIDLTMSWKHRSLEFVVMMWDHNKLCKWWYFSSHIFIVLFRSCQGLVSFQNHSTPHLVFKLIERQSQLGASWERFWWLNIQPNINLQSNGRWTTNWPHWMVLFFVILGIHDRNISITVNHELRSLTECGYPSITKQISPRFTCNIKFQLITFIFHLFGIHKTVRSVQDNGGFCFYIWLQLFMYSFILFNIIFCSCYNNARPILISHKWP